MTQKTLTQRLKDVFAQVAKDMAAAEKQRGSLSALTTDDKTSLVAAINELKQAAASASGINDQDTSSASTWSSQKIEQTLQAAAEALKTEILGGASEAWNTLKEIETYIESDKTGAAALAEAINKRIRFDEAQVLTPEQQKQACDNLGLGDPNVDLVEIYTQAKG